MLMKLLRGLSSLEFSNAIFLFLRISELERVNGYVICIIMSSQLLRKCPITMYWSLWFLCRQSLWHKSFDKQKYKQKYCVFLSMVELLPMTFTSKAYFSNGFLVSSNYLNCITQFLVLPTKFLVSFFSLKT